MTPGKYFVGGVAGQTTAETLRAYFSQYGEIEDSVVMMRDGRPRGFGFVTFKNPDAIPPSLTGSTHTIDGKQVEIKSAVPSAEYRTSAGSTKLFLGGLSNNTTKEMLEAHFGQFGTITDSVVMETNGVPRGFGFVSFETAEMANAACQYSPHMLDNKIVDVKKAEPRGSPHLNSSMMGQGFYPGMGMHQAPGPMRSQGRMAGGQAPPNANPQRLAYRSTEQPHAKDAKVFVGGLAKDTNEETLINHFGKYGTINGCEVMRRDGVSRGFAFVLFSTEDEAAAILANPQHMIDGKLVEVKTCHPKESMGNKAMGGMGMGGMGMGPMGMGGMGMGMGGMGMGGMGMGGMGMGGMGMGGMGMGGMGMGAGGMGMGGMGGMAAGAMGMGGMGMPGMGVGGMGMGGMAAMQQAQVADLYQQQQGYQQDASYGAQDASYGAGAMRYRPY